MFLQGKGIRMICSFYPDKVDEWLDAGEVGFGPLIAQVTMATDEYRLNEMQEDFLKFHDRKTRRLDFLWEVHKIFLILCFFGGKSLF